MERGVRSPRASIYYGHPLASTNGTSKEGGCWLVSSVESDSSKERLQMSLRLNRLALCASAHIGQGTEEGMTESSNPKSVDAEG
jgi:hypothetical protein